MILPMHSDINECVLDTDNDCDDNAECNNTVGGFNCTCEPGYMGNGTMCTGIVIGASNCNTVYKAATCVDVYL